LKDHVSSLKQRIRQIDEHKIKNALVELHRLQSEGQLARHWRPESQGARRLGGRRSVADVRADAQLGGLRTVYDRVGDVQQIPGRMETTTLLKGRKVVPQQRKGRRIRLKDTELSAPSRVASGAAKTVTGKSKESSYNRTMGHTSYPSGKSKSNSKRREADVYGMNGIRYDREESGSLEPVV